MSLGCLAVLAVGTALMTAGCMGLAERFPDRSEYEPVPAFPNGSVNPLQTQRSLQSKSTNQSVSSKMPTTPLQSKSTFRPIQPSNPAQRAEQVENVLQVGRNDPFAPSISRIPAATTNPGIATSPSILMPAALSSPVPLPSTLPQLPSTTQLPVVVSVPALPPIAIAPTIAPSMPVAQLPTLPPSTPTPVQNPPISSMPATPTVSQVPVMPVSLARAIQVMGVVQTKGKASAIIEVPGEGTPRSVYVGDRLGNGTVLVKRIQTNGSQEPIVILEERGQEVIRSVGSTAINASTY